MISVGVPPRREHGRSGARTARRPARTGPRDDRRAGRAPAQAPCRTRPDDHPGHRHLRLGPLAPAAVGQELGEPEIENFDEAAFGAHQVCALDVAVHNPARVSFIERVGYLMRTEHSLIKVLDFGLAKFLSTASGREGTQAQMTMAGMGIRDGVLHST